MINKHIILGIAAVLTSTAAFAQEETQTIERDVDVVNSYLPTLRSHHKLQVEPVMDDTMQYNPTFKYNVLGRIEHVKTTPDSIKAASMSFPREESLYNSLVKGGVGNSDAMAELWYNIPQNKDYHLALNLGHHSAYGKIKLENDEKISAPNHKTWANVNFARFTDLLRFEGALNFKNKIYQYYGNSLWLATGVGSIDPNIHSTEKNLLLYNNSEIVNVSAEDIFADEKQRNTEVDATLSLANPNRDRREKTTFNAMAHYGFFANKTGVHQNDLNIGGYIRFPIKENYLVDIKTYFNNFNVSVPKDPSSRAYHFEERSHTDISINPHFGVDYDNIKLKLGVNMIMEIGGEEDNIYMQPDIRADFNIADGLVRLNIGLIGDYKANSYRDLVNECPYLSPDVTNYIWSSVYGIFGAKTEIKTTQQPFKFDVGLRVAFSRSVEMHLGMEYGTFDDQLFFVNNAYKSRINMTPGKETPTYDTIVTCQSNRFGIITDNGKHFRGKAELQIEPSSKFKMLINAAYNNWKMDYIEEAWNKPVYELGLNVQVKPTSALTVKLNTNLIGERYALDLIANEKVKLKSILDINLGANYALTDRFNVFLDANNIAAQDEQMWLGYSSRRIGVIAGVTYKF